MKVRIVHDEAAWCYLRRAKILQEYAPADIQIEAVPFPKRWEGEAPDLLYDLNYGHIADVRHVTGYLEHWKNTLLVSAFNHGWPSRKEYFDQACQCAHAVVCNNAEFWEQAGRLPGTYHISNGVDLRTFRSIVPIAERPLKVGWVGSEHHKETKNYNQLLVALADRLKPIECDFRLTDPYGPNVLNPKQMADWYNTLSVYVVASKTEGTPNPALEAAACGCAIVTTNVGNMPELIRHGVNGFFAAPTVDSLERSVRLGLQQREKWSAAMLEDIKAWDWRERAESFYSLFRSLHAGELPLLRERGTR